MNTPRLPAHFRHTGKTTWSASDYATNAIEQHDKQGRRTALSLADCSAWEWNDHGSFETCLATGTQTHAWLWRAGADEALFYHAGLSPSAVGKRLDAAIKEQKTIDKAHGRPVLDAPVALGWKERK